MHYFAQFLAAASQNLQLRGLGPGIAVLFYAEIRGTVQEVGKAKWALVMDSEPTEPGSALHNSALLSHAVSVPNIHITSYFVDITHVYLFTSNDNFPNHLG